MYRRTLASVGPIYIWMVIVSSIAPLREGVIMDPAFVLDGPRSIWARFQDDLEGAQGTQEVMAARLALDTDGDGLSDDQEIPPHGTDPRQADTDGDGLSDGEEVLVFGSNPLSSLPDHDNDGLTDRAETVFGPLEPYLAQTGMA